MKIIEGLKQIKDLKRKVSDLRGKINRHSAYYSHETPVYPDQKKQVEEWTQSCRDIIKEILRLHLAIQKTNLAVNVAINIGGKEITKSIAAWVLRRRELAGMECDVYKNLNDKGLQEKGMVGQSDGSQIPVTLVRCYDPITRDNRIEELTSEPSLIDSRLEVVNAITDLIED